jgi:hypothetical protein
MLIVIGYWLLVIGYWLAVIRKRGLRNEKKVLFIIFINHLYQSFRQNFRNSHH